MLFTSYIFLLVFLPCTLLAVHGLQRLGLRTASKLALLCASLCFYTWWDIRNLPVLLTLVVFNYVVAKSLLGIDKAKRPLRTGVLVLGLAGNLATLGYYKYAMFATNTLADAGLHVTRLSDVLLPLGLSFITFQKIALLVDAYAGAFEELPLLDYALFVTFFPQLISGPIVHHRELIPQFSSPKTFRFSGRAFAVGLALFAMGFGKKVLLADGIAPYVSPQFTAVAGGASLKLFHAWLCAVSYALQVYFDFSGYSDMAIGLALLFGLHLPFNFDSPYKSQGAVEFWQRWHITLTRFLTAYVYNPISLGLLRRRARLGLETPRRGKRLGFGAFLEIVAFPTLVTMFLSGLWHGAGFQFIALGLMHGVYLVINQAYRLMGKHDPKQAPSATRELANRALMFVAASAACIFFGCDSLRSGLRILGGMAGLSGVDRLSYTQDSKAIGFVLLLFAISQLFPNTQQIVAPELAPLRVEAGLEPPRQETSQLELPRRFALSFRPTLAWGLLLGFLLVGACARMLNEAVFLYFTF